MKRLMCLILVSTMCLCSFIGFGRTEVRSDRAQKLAEIVVNSMTHEQRVQALKGLGESLFGPVIDIVKIYMRATELEGVSLQRPPIKYLGRSPSDVAREKAAFSRNKAKHFATRQRFAREKAARHEVARKKVVAENKLRTKRDKAAKAKRKKDFEKAVAARKELLRNCTPEVRIAINAGRVFLGMTRGQARLSWGDPKSINTTIASYGVHEQWIYSVLGHRYLYFENGALTTIQK